MFLLLKLLRLNEMTGITHIKPTITVHQGKIHTLRSFIINAIFQ